MTLWHLFDLLLATLTLCLAWAAISSADLRRSVVLFITFGLLLAIVWARLLAPDLALAEAAIGAGLSGALLLSALRDQADHTDGDDLIAGPFAIVINVLSLALMGIFAWVLLQTLITVDSARLADEITEKLNSSGVSNPVTAVLLNFRAYDTLLELAVLLTAALGMLALGTARAPYNTAGPLLASLVRWLVPLLVLTAGYLLWAGAHSPGGAFQAGATLGAAAVMLRLAGQSPDERVTPTALRLLLSAGVAAFLLAGIATTALQLNFLQYPKGWSAVLILLIETGATLAIAATLALAYSGGRPANWQLELAGNKVRR